MRKCLICGTEYDYCPNCKKYSHLPRWMFSYHDENCKNIGTALNDYKAKNKTPIEVKRVLESTDLSNIDSFKPVFKDMINEILDIDKGEKDNNGEHQKNPTPMPKKYNNSEVNKFSSKKNYNK